ncbi:MAG: hypothetical protein AAGU74_12515 [Bacillota bacterium]
MPIKTAGVRPAIRSILRRKPIPVCAQKPSMGEQKTSKGIAGTPSTAPARKNPARAIKNATNAGNIIVQKTARRIASVNQRSQNKNNRGTAIFPYKNTGYF